MSLAPLPLAPARVTAGRVAAGEELAPGGVVRGSSFRSAMPHRLEAMKYRHRPLATLKNITPMKIIMYCMIFCCIAACSSAGGGINIFCCQMNSPIVMHGNRLK